MIPTVVAVVALGAAGFYYRSHSSVSKLTDKDTIVLADFDNKTGDVAFDDTLKQALGAELGQSPFLNILSDQRVADTLKMMGRQPTERLSKDMAREICQRTSSTAMLTGSIGQVGSHYNMVLNAINCSTGDLFATSQTEVDDKDHVLSGLGKLGTGIREKLGESFTTIQKFDKPLEQVTTSSLEALKAYTQGEKVANAGEDAPAIPYFKRAIELDPNFASAWVSLGVRYSNLGENGLSNDAFSKALQLRDHVSDRERFRIEATNYMYVLGDLERRARHMTCIPRRIRGNFARGATGASSRSFTRVTKMPFAKPAQPCASIPTTPFPMEIWPKIMFLPISWIRQKPPSTMHRRASWLAAICSVEDMALPFYRTIPRPWRS